MKINLLLDHRTILANQAQPVNFALQFRADNSDTPRSKPAAFCVVLDQSGSMQGKPLQYAKEATCLAIRNMRREDEFALVLFQSSAQVLIPLQPCNDKQRLLDLVNKINPGGSTNLTGGWMLGRDELKKAPTEASRLLLLLSDGLLNVGLVDPIQVRQIVATAWKPTLFGPPRSDLATITTRNSWPIWQVRPTASFTTPIHRKNCPGFSRTSWMACRNWRFKTCGYA